MYNLVVGYKIQGLDNTMPGIVTTESLYKEMDNILESSVAAKTLWWQTEGLYLNCQYPNVPSSSSPTLADEAVA